MTKAQVKSQGTGKYEIDKLLPKSLSIRQVQGKLQQLKLHDTEGQTP